MNSKTTLIAILFLAGGLLLGSAFSSHRYPKLKDGMHMMPKGEMMNDHDMHRGNMSMDGMMMDMTARMENKTGDELDKVFLEDMIVHHEGAVAMAKLLQKGTTRPELQKMAQDIITVQTKEIETMKGWLSSWFQISK